MPALAALALFDDSSIATIVNSPFSVPIFGTFMILGITVARIWSGIRTREMQSQERLAAIAKGIPLPHSWDEAPQRSGPINPGSAGSFPLTSRSTKARQGGIVLVCIGFSMVGFFIFLSAIVHVREILIPAAAGIFPLAIGIGLLIDSRIRAAEAVRHPSLYAAPEPPPTHAAPSAAGSDWNPLH